MPVKVYAKFELKVDTVFGDALIMVHGPIDEDGDGDPEIEVKVDLPGKSMDFSHKVEVPMPAIVGNPIELAMIALRDSNIPGADVIVSALESLIGE